MAREEEDDNQLTVSVATTAVIEHEMTPAMQAVVSEIDSIFGDLQASSLNAFWRVGKLIAEVRDDPDRYLTEEQQSSHIDGAALIISIFAPVYTVEQLKGAVTFYERYPSEADLRRLLSLRNPDRPRWRLTISHVQMLTQVADDYQRGVLEEKCVEDAYTARALALELQEMRGKKKNSGRTHQAPKGLKQQLVDLLQHQRRFIARSQKLWYNEDEDDIYDGLANAPSSVHDDPVIRGHFAEVVDNFDRLADVIRDNMAMCRKLAAEVFDAETVEPAPADEPVVDVPVSRRPSGATKMSSIHR